MEYGDELPQRSLCQWAEFLQSLGRGKNAHFLPSIREYRDFVKAAQALANVHHQLEAFSQPAFLGKNSDVEREDQREALSHIQHLASDEVLLRVFDFLECKSLIQASMTCARFRDLSYLNARRRTHKISQERQLRTAMELLRAQEQMDGSDIILGPVDATTSQHRSEHVRIPTLLLSRRVLVTNSGDPEYNGVYYCTGCNGNGYVFTKPRNPIRMIYRPKTSQSWLVSSPDPGLPGREQSERMLLGEQGSTGTGCKGEVKRPLLCVISKRYSNEVRQIYCRCVLITCPLTLLLT